MDKPKLIVLEGSTGAGKSTIARELREKLPYTTFLDLSAIGDKSIDGRDKMYKYHKSILEMVENCKYSEMNFLFSRSFMSEQVFCSLGYKPYDFKTQTLTLMKELEYLTNWYQIYFIVLTSTEEEFKERLQRDKFEYNPFSVENSMAQQEQYKKELRKLARVTESIRCFEVPNRNIDDTVEVIMNSILTNMIG